MSRKRSFLQSPSHHPSNQRTESSTRPLNTQNITDVLITTTQKHIKTRERTQWRCLLKVNKVKWNSASRKLSAKFNVQRGDPKSMEPCTVAIRRRSTKIGIYFKSRAKRLTSPRKTLWEKARTRQMTYKYDQDRIFVLCQLPLLLLTIHNAFSQNVHHTNTRKPSPRQP